MNTYKMNDLILKTSMTANTTPNGNWDWACIGDNYDGAPDASYHAVGYGRNEADAIKDYLDCLDDE